MIRSKWIKRHKSNLKFPKTKKSIVLNHQSLPQGNLQVLRHYLQSVEKKGHYLQSKKLHLLQAKVLDGNFERLINLKNLKHVIKHVYYCHTRGSFVEISRNQSQIRK